VLVVFLSTQADRQGVDISFTVCLYSYGFFRRRWS